MSMRGKMQNQVQLAFTGYDALDVESALSTIIKKSSNFNIIVNGDPISHDGLMKDQPRLRGCDKKDVIVFSMLLSGSLKNIKDLVKSETPNGVQIELLSYPA